MLARNQSAQIETLQWDLSQCQDTATVCDEAASSDNTDTSTLESPASSSQNSTFDGTTSGCSCNCSNTVSNGSEGSDDKDDESDSVHPAAWAVAEHAVLADAAQWAQRGLLGNATSALEDGIMRRAHQSSAVLPLALGTLLLRRGLPHQALLACRSAVEAAANSGEAGARSNAFGDLATARAELCIGRSLMLTTSSSKSRRRSRPRPREGGSSESGNEEDSGPLGAAAAFKRAVDLFRAHSGRAESSPLSSVRLDPNLVVVVKSVRSNRSSAAALVADEEVDALADWGAALQSAGQGGASVHALEAAMALIVEEATMQAARGADSSTFSSDKESLVMSLASLQRATRLAYNLGLAKRAAGDFTGSVKALEDAEQLSHMVSTYETSGKDSTSDDEAHGDDGDEDAHSGDDLDMSSGSALLSSSSQGSAPCPTAIALALGAALADAHQLDAAVATTRRAQALAQSAASKASVSVSATSASAAGRASSDPSTKQGNNGASSGSESWAAPGAAAMAVLGSAWGGVSGDAAYGPRAGLNLGLLFLRQADDFANFLHGDGKHRGSFVGGGTDVGGTAADAGSSAALRANQRMRALEAAATEFDAVLQDIDNAAAAALANVQAATAATRVSAFGPLGATAGAAPPLQLLLPPPALAAAVAGSATAHRLLGHEPLALAMLARLLRLPPGLLPPRVRRKAGFDLGRALRQQSRFYEALEVLEAAAAVPRASSRLQGGDAQRSSSVFDDDGDNDEEAWTAAWARAEDEDGAHAADGQDKDSGLSEMAQDGAFVASSSLWTVSDHDLWLELGLTRHVVSARASSAAAATEAARSDVLTQSTHAGPRGAAVAYRRALSTRPNSVPALKLLAAALEDSATESGKGASSSSAGSSNVKQDQKEFKPPLVVTEESIETRHARLRVVLGEVAAVAPPASEAGVANAASTEGDPGLLQLGSSAQPAQSTIAATNSSATAAAAAEVDALVAAPAAAAATPADDTAPPADSPPTDAVSSADETPAPEGLGSSSETIEETVKEPAEAVSGDTEGSAGTSSEGEATQNESADKRDEEAGDQDSADDEDEEDGDELLADYEEPPAPPLPTFPDDSAAAVKTASAYLKIGRAYATTGKWELALKEARKAMLKAPSLAAPHALAAQALETTRHFSEAAAAHLDAFARNVSDWTGADAALRLASAGTSASSSVNGGGGGVGSGSPLLARAEAQAVLQRLLGELRGGLLERALASTDGTSGDGGDAPNAAAAAAATSEPAAAVGSSAPLEPFDRLSIARLALGQLLRADATEHRTKAQQYTQRADAYATAAAKARGTTTNTAAAGSSSGSSGDDNDEEEVMDLDAAPEVDFAQAAKLDAAEAADRTAAADAQTQADTVATEADSSLQRCSGNSSKLAMLCLDQRAKLAFEREQYKAAVVCWRSAARVATEKGQHSEAAVHYANVGAAKRELNSLNSATAAYEQALVSAAAAATATTGAATSGGASPDVAAQIHFNLGVTKHQLGDAAGALASWDSAHKAGLRHPRLNQLREDAQRNLTVASGGSGSTSGSDSDAPATAFGSGSDRLPGRAAEATAEQAATAKEVPSANDYPAESRQAAPAGAATYAATATSDTTATAASAAAAAASASTAPAAAPAATASDPEGSMGGRQPPAGVRRQRYSHLFDEQQSGGADNDGASPARAASAPGGATAATAGGQRSGSTQAARSATGAVAGGSTAGGLESNTGAEDEESSLESKLFAGLGDEDDEDEDGGFGNSANGGSGWSLSTAFQHAGKALSHVPKHVGAGVAAVKAWLDPEEAELEKLRALALAPVDVPNPHLARQQAGGSGVGRGSDSAAAQRAQMAAAFAQQQRSAKAASAGGAVGGAGGRAGAPAGVAPGDASGDATGDLGMQELLEQLRQKRAAQTTQTSQASQQVGQQQVGQQHAAAQRGVSATAKPEEPQDLFAQFRQQQERQQQQQQQQQRLLQQQQRQAASTTSPSAQGSGAPAARGSSAEDGVGGLQELLAQLQQQQQPQAAAQQVTPQQAVQQQLQQQEAETEEESDGLQALLQRLREKKLAEHQQQQQQQKLEDQALEEDHAEDEEEEDEEPESPAAAASGMLAAQNANTIGGSSSSSSSSSLNQLLADLRAQQAQQQRSGQEEGDETGESEGGAFGGGGGLSGIHGMLSGDEEVDEAHSYQAASNKGGSRG